MHPNLTQVLASLQPLLQRLASEGVPQLRLEFRTYPNGEPGFSVQTQSQSASYSPSEQQVLLGAALALRWFKGEVTFDLVARTVALPGQTLELTPEYALPQTIEVTPNE